MHHTSSSFGGADGWTNVPSALLRGFKPTVALTTDWANAEITDSASKRSLKLTGTEARVLQLFDGTQSAQELALQASVEGLIIDPPTITALLDRLKSAGFLAHKKPASQVSQLLPVAPLSWDDHPPPLREDLQIVATPGAKGTMQVTDPVAERSFTLYDFEVSIARMLNGQRTAGEIIEAAAKIGIPVALDSLQKFLRQLKSYGFLGEARGEGQTWPDRSAWTPEARELFQSALRMMRSGKGNEALGYLSALLQIDPENSEAKEMAARAQELAAAVEVPMEMNFEELHGDPETSTSSARLAPVAPPAEASVAGLPKTKLIRFGAIGAGVLLLVVFAFPVGQTKYLQGEIAPISLGTITSPASGKVTALSVSEGQLVEAGQLLALVGTEELDGKRKQLEAKSNELDQKHTALNQAVKPVLVAKAKMALAPKQRELEFAQADLKKLQDAAAAAKPGAAKVRADRAVKVQRVVVAKKQFAFDQAQKALAAVTLEPKIKANRDEAVQVEEQLSSLKESPGIEVHSPSAGRLRGLPPLGAKVEQGAEFGRLVAPGELRVTVKDPALPAGTDVRGATLSAGKVTGVAVAAFKWETGTPPLLVGKLLQPPAEIAPGPTVVEVALKRRPFLLSLFGQ